MNSSAPQGPAGQAGAGQGGLGLWLNPGNSNWFPAAVCAQNRSCGQATGMEESEAESKLGTAFTLKGSMVMPLEHFSFSGFGLCL